jgi:hypothetical protein
MVLPFAGILHALLPQNAGELTEDRSPLNAPSAPLAVLGL